MGYTLRRDETIEEGTRRIAAEQITGALRSIDVDDPDVAVHEVRKGCKKLRALLRLMRDAFGPEHEKENTRFREIGRRLSEFRDRGVRVETYQKLGALFPEHRAVCAEIERLCVLERSAQEVAQLRALAETVVDLGAALTDVETWSIGGRGFEAIEPGLKRSYRKARRALPTCAEDVTSEHLHEWRKRVKDCWYHVRLLTPVWEPAMSWLRSELSALAKALGEEHDLAVLRSDLVESTHAGARSLVEPIDEHRERLREEVRGQGERIFAERPRGLIRRIAVYWRAWRVERPLVLVA
jgi:CHAD domain-containing protein